MTLKESLWLAVGVIGAALLFLPTSAIERGLKELWLTWTGKSKNIKTKE